MGGTRTFSAFGNGQSVFLKTFNTNRNMKTETNKNSALQTAKKWWKETDFRQMEWVTGFMQCNYNPEDGYQEFVEVCDKW